MVKHTQTMDIKDLALAQFVGLALKGLKRTECVTITLNIYIYIPHTTVCQQHLTLLDIFLKFARHIQKIRFSNF